MEESKRMEANRELDWKIHTYTATVITKPIRSISMALTRKFKYKER